MEDPKQVIADYIAFRGGKRVIQRILIANNGLAAVRFMRRLREWSFEYLGSEKALHFICMPTPEDIEAACTAGGGMRQANAEYFRLADEFKVVPGGSNKNNFAKVDLIIEIAKQVKADAVWPGWGHASEYPALPNGLEKAGIVFMGPSGRSMDAVGDKICANLLAQSVGVNVIPWSGSGLKTDGVELSPELIKQATLASVEECVESAKKVGFPLMIKASEGGGGKGIRMVHNMEQLRVGYDQVAKEVVGSPIFIQKLGQNARHLEVQVVADEYGNTISLYGRDCSVQRRHQKVIEEGPVQVCGPELRQELEEGAVRLCKFVGYRSAGTVEYLYSPDNGGEYSFLEVNPRLQVEHPVTEGITGVCVPAIQLNVAMGVPLYNIPDIRKFYNEDPAGNTKIDFETAKPHAPLCHTVAARITAENPEDGFKPSSGAIYDMFYRPVRGVSASFSVSGRGAVHQFADSQFGHLFSHGATREIAIKQLLSALQEITVRGEISNNTVALQHILESPEFTTDTHNTHWLDVEIAKGTEFVPKLPELDAVVCGAVVTAYNKFVEHKKEVMNCLERGVVPDLSVTGYSCQSFDLIYKDIKYPIVTSACSDSTGMQSSVDITINGSKLQAEVVNMFDQGIKVLFNSKAHVVYSERAATGLKVVVDGRVYFFPDDADPTALQTVSAGKLVSYLVKDGDVVQPGQPYAEIEVMKTIMPLLALNGPGKVTTLMQPGMPLEAGAVLARLELAAGAEVKMAIPFTGTLPEVKIALTSSSVSNRVQTAKAATKAVMDGYGALFPPMEELASAVLDPAFPAAEAAELLATLAAPLPKAAEDALKKIAAGSAGTALVADASAGAAAVAGTVEASGPVGKFFATYARGGSAGALVAAVTAVLQDYLAVENIFDIASTYQDAVLELRDANKESLGVVAGYALSHSQLKRKNALVMAALAHIKSTATVESYIETLAALSDLEKPEYAPIAQEAKQLLFSVDQDQRKKDHTRRRNNPNAPVVTGGLGKLGRTNSLDSLNSGFEEEQTTYDAPECAAPIPDINVEGIFNDADKAAQAQAVKEYFETVGINNAIQASGAVVKMQYGNGASAYVAADVAVVPAIVQKIVSEGLVTRANILLPMATTSEAAVAEMIEDHKAELEASEVSKVSFTLLGNDKAPVYMTFCRALEFGEDKAWRGTEPALGLQMELDRLCNFDVQTVSRSPANAYQSGTPDYRLQVMFAKEVGDQAARGAVDVRLFLRAAVYNSAFFLAQGVTPAEAKPASGLRRSNSFSSFDDSTKASGISESNVLVDMMRNLELAVGQRPSASNLFFINLVSASAADMATAEATVAYFVSEFLPELTRLKVTAIEVKVAGGRIVANAGGARFKVERHTDDEMSGEAEHPYPVLNRMQRKKLVAQNANSTYIYDFLEIFEDIIGKSDPSWATGGLAGKDDASFKATELVVNAEGNLEEARRPPGNNDCGMVIFRCWMRTPECRMGREFVIVGSDLSFQSGSFSPREDIVYYKALEMCRKEGIPAVYIAANSGARIGLNEDVKNCLQVAWADPSNPSKGYDYLYLSEGDYNALSTQVHAVKMAAGGETRYRIVDVFGGCGVECLQGSGMIANATSAAYDETVTITYVTGRSVGIGAYISRLSQRIIQHTDAPLLLTGAAALNKVLGRQVYSSNSQIGGPKVMHHNGVSHEVVNNDVSGCAAIVRWLSYVPAKKGASLPIYPSSDSVERRVEWMPPAGPYDPREMLAGGYMNGEFKRGFFDEGSFNEALSNWGKTVVTGRARLGGLPVGVVAVETRTQERVVPADPGFPTSTVQVIQQAGQVWFPDSAYKTANSINDFNREGIPLFVFANWRGFAGGQRDMFDEVLKYGSYIVDALRNYKQPVFVYLPCGGELRGGAWVVIDPTINPDMMRMYTSENAKGNVLEPEGIVEIKFRKPDLVKAMKRNDAAYAALEEGSDAQKKREKDLMPVYTQIAVQFAALHDTPGVMKHKGVVSDIVPWARSRTYFYKALRERLAEVALENEVTKMSPSMDKAAVHALIAGELAEATADLAAGTASMTDVRITSVMKKLHAQHVAEAVTSMPVEAVLAGLLKEHSPEALAAMLAGKPLKTEE